MAHQNIEGNPFLALFPSPTAAQNFLRRSKDDYLHSNCMIEQWTPNEIYENVFCITLDKNNRKPSSRKPASLVYMSDSCQSADNKVLDSENLNQVVFDRLMMTEIASDDIIEIESSAKNTRICATETRIINYLHQCFVRYKKLKHLHQDYQDIFKLCLNVIVSNSVTVLGNISLFMETNPHDQFYEMLVEQEPSVVEYLDAVSNKINVENGMDELCKVMHPLFEIIEEKLSKYSFTDTAVATHISILHNIFSFSSLLSQAVIMFSTVNEHAPGKGYESTLLGWIFSYSCLPSKVGSPHIFFNNPSRSSSQEHRITEGNIWGIMMRRSSDLGKLVHSGLKVSPDSKHKILSWIGDLIRKNMGRTRMANHHNMMALNASNSVSDGFMLNLSTTLLILCKRFTDQENIQSVLKVDSNYMKEAIKKVDGASEQGIHLRNMAEETCLIPTLDDNVDTRCNRSFSFVTECFFMTHYCVYSGFCVIHAKIVQISQDLSRQQHLYDDIRNQAGVGSPETMENIRSVLDQGMTQYLSLKAAMLLPELLDRMMDFMTASSVWLVNVALGNTFNNSFIQVQFPLPENMSDRLSSIPEFVLENITDFVIFVRRFSPYMFEAHGPALDHFMTFILVFMGNPKAVRNPHMRAKLAEMLECLMPHAEEEIRMESVFSNYHRQKLFNSHPHISQVMKTLLHVFVSIEMTGQSVEFEQKFNYRRPMYVILEFIWKIDLHRDSMKKLVEEAEQSLESVEPPLFLRFINLLINDSIFLLDEALSYMKQLREQQQAIDRKEWDELPQNQRTQNEQNFRHMGMLARFHNVMSNETIHALMFITEDIKSIFMHPILVDRITAMLNYFLVHLAGPKKKNFKVKDLSEYDFKPQQILSDICQIYLNLGHVAADSGKFCAAVAGDERSYSPLLFDQTIMVLQKIGKADIFQDFKEFSVKIKSIYEKNMIEEETMGEAPDEFLDPIMSTVMLDPVFLPTSNMIVDRSTISRHLLSDQTDPFNRSPLTMDMIKSEETLKKRIHDWLQSHKQS